MISFKTHVFNLLLLLISVSLGQQHPGIHQRQAEYYRTHYVIPAAKPDTTPIIPLQPRMVTPNKTIFGYHPYWEGTAWQDYNFDLLTTIAYFSADVTTSGLLSNLHGWPNTGLINTAHSHGVKVVLVATLFGSSSLSTLLSSASNRKRLINNLLNEVQSANGDGVNIDFEIMPSSQKNNMVQFITALVDTFHTHIPGSEVTLAMPAVDWSNAWDYNALASISDGLFIMGYDYYYSGSSTSGPVSPLTGGGYNVTTTVNDYLSKTGNQASKIILGIPYYGIQWPTSSSSAHATTTGSGSAVIYSTAVTRAQTYGRLWDNTSQTPWYAFNNGHWNQGWYDDSESLGLKYNLALDRNLQGVGMWALGYDQGHQELWNLLATTFGDEIPPSPVVNEAVLQSDGVVRCVYSGGDNADSYSVVRYDESRNELDTVGPFTGNPFAIAGLPMDEPSWIRIKSENNNGTRMSTDYLAIMPAANTADVLLVQGFDRTSGTTNHHDSAIRHGKALAALGWTFDSATNEAVDSGFVDLNEYPMVDWILGKEGTVNSSFTLTEQNLISTYLESGGKLLVTGSEIGYDLVAHGSADDQTFYTDYLKAEYISDAAGGPQEVYEISGTGILQTLGTVHYDNGSHGSHDVNYPDGILPVGGGEICATYPGVDTDTQGAAGISYSGKFGSSDKNGALVYLAVGFETFYPASTRDSLMYHIVDFLNPEPVNGSDSTEINDPLAITKIFPNPLYTYKAKAIIFQLKMDSTLTPSLSVYNILGQKITETQIEPTDVEHVWSPIDDRGRTVPSGVYFAVLRDGNFSARKKFTVIR